jgi:hypothetical protein
MVVETDCPQCYGAGEIPKIGLDEDGNAINDLWKVCAHCEFGVVCAYCEEKPTLCLSNAQCEQDE